MSPSSSVVFGLIGAIACNFALGLKKFLPIDDAFDVFCVHGIGAITGNLLTGVFAERSIAALDGFTRIKGGGFYDGNWAQVGIQAIDTLAGSTWSFFMSLIILCIINSIRGLELKARPEDEESGLDKAELGLSMYEFVDEIKSELELLKEQLANLQTPKGSMISVTSMLTPIEYCEKSIDAIEENKEPKEIV